MKNSVKILAFIASGILGMAGTLLLLADIADDSPLIEQIGWLTAFLVTKITAFALMGAAGIIMEKAKL